MAPASKSESAGGATGKSSHRHSKTHEKQSSMDSPSSRQSYGSSRTSGGHKGHHRRRRSSPTALKSSLRETLSSFGDDVIRVKKYPGQHAYDNHGYFQSDLSFNTNAKDMVEKDEESAFPGEKDNEENELAVIMSHHDPSFQTRHFEKVNPNEVGVRPSKWQQLLQSSVTSSRFQKLKRQSKKRKPGGDVWALENNFLETFYDASGKINCDPPFWGVSRGTRGSFSFLTLSMILHELACFTSCVLLGCMIFQGMEAISWAQQKPLTENWLLFKWYSSFQTILVVITCLGFLNRVDTTDIRSLWLLPLFLVPVLGLGVSDYCNKAWELQRLECLNHFRLDELGKQKVHLSQDCSWFEKVLVSIAATHKNGDVSKMEMQKLLASTASMTELTFRGVGPLVMRILAMLSILVISIYLFCCRKNYFLIDLFGPPPEFEGNLELALFDDKSSKRVRGGSSEAGNGNESDEEMKVIFKRN